jgi:hypothetical protein
MVGTMALAKGLYYPSLQATLLLASESLGRMRRFRGGFISGQAERRTGRDHLFSRVEDTQQGSFKLW